MTYTMTIGGHAVSSNSTFIVNNPAEGIAGEAPNASLANLDASCFCGTKRLQVMVEKI